jgi:hypothetical protein
MGLIDSVDTMILGANTYVQAKDYWPYADDQGEYGEKLINLKAEPIGSNPDTCLAPPAHLTPTHHLPIEK